MWIDERGSEILGSAECRHLLAVGAREGQHGHLGFETSPPGDAPVILPVNYTVHGSDVVVRVSDTLSKQVVGHLVAFEVDGVGSPSYPAWRHAEDGRPWSVLVRGLAMAAEPGALGSLLPVPEVAAPGECLVRIRADVVSGRRLQLARAADHEPSA